MKHLDIITLIACVAFVASCQSTEKRAENKERANRAAARQQAPQDESQQNLMNAQRDVVNRDGNPMAGH